MKNNYMIFDNCVFNYLESKGILYLKFFGLGDLRD